MKLNISERLYALRILNEFKGSLEKLAVILEDIKQFPILAEDWDKAERKISEDTWTWNDEKGGEKDIEVKKETAAYLRESIDKKSETGELTMQDKAAISLREKLK